MNLDHPLAAAALTIIGGAMTLAVGQIIVAGYVEHALELKREIGRIAYSLVFYANKRFEVACDQQAQTREAFRTHASRLYELSKMVTFYRLWQVTLRLPDEANVMKASAALIGHSNFPAEPDGCKYDRTAEIRELLNVSH